MAERVRGVAQLDRAPDFYTQSWLGRCRFDSCRCVGAHATLSPSIGRGKSCVADRKMLGATCRLRRQSRSNQVSGRSLLKMGIFAKPAERLSAIWPATGAKWEGGDWGQVSETRQSRPFLLIPGCHAERRTAWLGREDSNLRMVESKSTALPLGDAPMTGLDSGGRQPTADSLGNAGL